MSNVTYAHYDQLAWDRLHTTNYRTVDVCWRRLFGLAKFLQVHCQLLNVGEARTTPVDDVTNTTSTTTTATLHSIALPETLLASVVRELDLVVIMSDDSFGQFAKQLIEQLENSSPTINTNNDNNNNDNNNDDNNNSESTKRRKVYDDDDVVPSPLQLRNVRSIARTERLSVLDFETRYHETSTPVIITDVAQHWPVMFFLCVF